MKPELPGIPEPPSARQSSARIPQLTNHGVRDLNLQPDIGIIPRDDRFELPAFLQTPLPNAFATFLRAHETTNGDDEHPNRTVSYLAAATLLSGFKTVIAALWYVTPVYSGPNV